MLSARSFALWATLIVAASCARLVVTTATDPTPAGSGWQTYSELETGVAVNLPMRWRVVNPLRDISTQLDAIQPIDPGVKTRVNAFATNLRSSQVRFFAFDPVATPEGAISLGFVTCRPAPPEGLEAYADRISVAGTRLDGRETIAGNAGTMVLRRLTDTNADLEVVRYQFILIKGEQLCALVLETSTKSLDGQAFRRIGTSFTPLP